MKPNRFLIILLIAGFILADVSLANWTEPLLFPNLPDLVKLGLTLCQINIVAAWMAVGRAPCSFN